jgi:hypothetical protein
LPYIRPAGYSTLVVVLLWEGKSGAAWQAATAGDCWDEPWLRAARERAATHPADAIPTLLAAADQAIGHKNRDSYQVATRLLMEAFAIPALRPSGGLRISAARCTQRTSPSVEPISEACLDD